MFLHKSLVWCGIVSILGTIEATAATVTLTFTGSVSQVTEHSGAASPYAIGDAVSGTVTYETGNVSLQSLSGDEAVYHVVPGTSPTLSFDFGSSTWETALKDTGPLAARTEDARLSVVNDRISATDITDSIGIKVERDIETRELYTGTVSANPAGFTYGGNSMEFYLGATVATGEPVPDFFTTTSVPTESNVNLAPAGALTGYGKVASSNALAADFLDPAFEGWEVEFAIDPTSLSFGEVVEPERFVPVTEGHLGKERALLGDLESSGEFAFDASKPIVIVTHGWQPDGPFDAPLWGAEYTGEIDSSDFSGDMYSAIKSKYPEDVNVLVYAWEEAYVGFIDGLGNDDNELPAILPEVGQDLANKLSAFLDEHRGDDGQYPGNIHFVGHSYGSKVNLHAAAQLNSEGYAIEHFTILDAPIGGAPIDQGILTRQLNVEDFELFAFEARLQGTYVENYYGTDGIPVSAYGDVITNAEWFGGHAVNANHPQVAEEYVKTVPGQTGSTAFVTGGDGFLQSAALSELGGTWDNRLSSPIIVPEEITDDFLISSFSTQSSSIAYGTSFGNLLDLGQASDGYSVFEALIPENVSFLAFDLLFTNRGDGDWLEISFGDDLLYQMSGLVAPDEPLSTYLFFGDYTGQSGNLIFLLASEGELPASAQLRNLRWVSYENDISEVPLPASVLGLLTALITLIGFNRIRRA